MTITFTGDRFSSTERIKTPSYSLNWSLSDHLGNIGFPIRSFIEIYGLKNCGKTAFVLSMQGFLAKELNRKIDILDWEGQSRETVEGILSAQGFSGTVEYFLNVAKEKSEETIARFIESLYAKDQPISLMDSLGAFRPTANMEGALGDANMGAFSRESGRFADWVIAALQRADKPGCVFMTNHLHPKIGFRVTGQDTAGGEKKKYLAQLRIDLKRTFLKSKKDDGDDSGGGSTIDFGESWLLGGHIDSSRFGYSKRDFQVFMIGGEGIHWGLSSMWDCIVYGYAQLSSKKVTESTTVNLDGKSFGKIGHIISTRKDDDQFSPFKNALLASEVTPNHLEEKEE